MKLVAILRVKDEVAYIRRCLARLSELVDEIIILDNGSTDGTLAIYPEFPKVVELLQTEGFDEGRDKVLLHTAAQKRQPDWIIWCDGDEVFEPALTRAELNRYMSSKYNKVQFRMCNFWFSEKLFRIDGPYFNYTLNPQRSMWRNVEGTYFKDVRIHNGDIYGAKKPHYISPYLILHYGYADKEKTRQKYERYKEIDGNSSRSYEHLNPANRTLRLPYVSFSQPTVHYLYILFYKCIVTIVWIGYRVYKRIAAIFIKT